MTTSYSPVGWEYREQILEQIEKATCGKIFFFNENNAVDEAAGKIVSMEEIPEQGLFINLESAFTIRIDRIITLFGKPAAAYDEYNAYANSCMDCMGGYDKEQLDDM